jgi:hypothetical protein
LDANESDVSSCGQGEEPVMPSVPVCEQKPAITVVRISAISCMYRWDGEWAPLTNTPHGNAVKEFAGFVPTPKTTVNKAKEMLSLGLSARQVAASVHNNSVGVYVRSEAQITSFGNPISIDTTYEASATFLTCAQAHWQPSDYSWTRIYSYNGARPNDSGGFLEGN